MTDDFEDRKNTGRCIVAVPADDEPIHAFGEEDKHLTLLWLGKPDENPDLNMDTVREIVQNYAAENPPFIAMIDKTGELGDEGAKVAFLAADDVPQHEQLKSFSPLLQESYDAVQQFPSFHPHVTLTYDETVGDQNGDGQEEPPPNPTGTILFDRLAVWDGDDHQEYPFQRVTDLPVTDVFSLERAVALANKLPAGHVRDAARRVLSRRARALGCAHAIPSQWLRDRQAQARQRLDLVELGRSYAAKQATPSVTASASACFLTKASSSGIPDSVLRVAYMRGVRDYAMMASSDRPPLTRDQYAQARVNSLIRLAAGDLSARSDDEDLLKELS